MLVFSGSSRKASVQGKQEDVVIDRNGTLVTMVFTQMRAALQSEPGDNVSDMHSEMLWHLPDAPACFGLT